MRAKIFIAVILLALWWSATPAIGQDEGPSTPSLRAPDCGGGSIPLPSEGCGPETPGDPGGWQQLTLLAIILVAMLSIALLVRRQIRQATRLQEIEADPTA